MPNVGRCEGVRSCHSQVPVWLYIMTHYGTWNPSSNQYTSKEMIQLHWLRRYHVSFHNCLAAALRYMMDNSHYDVMGKFGQV
jgi:hypothetical protein